MAGARVFTRRDGFSLVELVVVILVSSLVAGLITSFVTRPMEAYGDVRLRATLVHAAESAIRRMQRDLRASLPNSIRVSIAGRSLELLNTADGARYRDAPGINPTLVDHTPATHWLDFSSGDAEWNVLGRFVNLPFTYPVTLPAGSRLAIYSTSTAVYAEAALDLNPGVITAGSTSITISDPDDEHHIALSSPHQFSLSSPRQGLYIVDTPVSYLCDLGGSTFTRYDGYAIASAQPTNPLIAPLSAAASALVTRNVTACQFGYSAGTPSRAGLVTIELTLASGGEQVRVLHQVHVDNTP